jgi:hypothetical protein
VDLQLQIPGTAGLPKLKKKNRITYRGFANSVVRFLILGERIEAESEDAMDGPEGTKEKRKRRRHPMDFPLEYRIINTPDAYGGIAVDGSEIGLRIHSIKNLPVGTRLNIAVIFPKEFQMSNFEVVAEIIWKDLCVKEDWSGYQYGLKFLLIGEEDLGKLKQLLNEEFQM